MIKTIIPYLYIIASVLFIFGLKMLGSAKTARRGNLISAGGMLLAIVAALLTSGLSYRWILVGAILGSIIGGVAARIHAREHTTDGRPFGCRPGG